MVKTERGKGVRRTEGRGREAGARSHSRGRGRRPSTQGGLVQSLTRGLVLCRLGGCQVPFAPCRASGQIITCF